MPYFGHLDQTEELRQRMIELHAVTAERDRLRDALQLVWDTYGMDPSVDSAIWQTVRAALAIETVKQTVPHWVWDIVEKNGITEKDAAQMLQWAFDQVHIAAALYAASTLPRPR